MTARKLKVGDVVMAKDMPEGVCWRSIGFNVVYKRTGNKLYVWTVGCWLYIGKWQRTGLPCIVAPTPTPSKRPWDPARDTDSFRAADTLPG